MLLACIAGANDTDGKGKAATQLRSGISPTLQPKSDEAFFGKGGDYPHDDRPGVDVFHFKHPYPVVQDSSDYDRDYVKDENSDNGYWAAQTEYDRLRHKLQTEKDIVQKALAGKEQAEKELEEVMKSRPKPKPKVPTKAKKPVSDGSEGQAASSNAEKVTPPGGESSPGAVKVATGETERAMKRLEDCKKELKEARENLKELMKELEKAKKLQQEAEEADTEAHSSAKQKRVEYSSMEHAVKDEYKEYMEAREAYLKQQAIVTKMENDIHVAAEKVRHFRDSEDASGGVFNSGGSDKSAAQQSAFQMLGFMPLLMLAHFVV